MTHASSRAELIGHKISKLKRLFFPTNRYEVLRAQFDGLLYRRRADLDAGHISEARGIMVIGASGTGKSTSLKRLFAKHDDLILSQDGSVRTDVVSLSIPSPATPKHVGLVMLNALGYPLRRDRTAAIIWEIVAHHLQERETLFLHLDEAQDFSNNRNIVDQQAMINTLKSLLQNSKWPVGVILSGMPSLLDLVNLDPQLSRRMIPVRFEPLDGTQDLKMVQAVLLQYCEIAGLNFDDAINTAPFLRRLIHSGASEFGIVVELVIDAIEASYQRDDQSLAHSHFVEAFARRSGCIDGINPFVIDDYKRIDVQLLLGQLHDELGGGSI